MLKNNIADNDFFKKSMFHALFLENPIGFIDVGARFGFHSLVDPMRSYVSFLGFEPDQEECDRLNNDTYFKNYWNTFKVLPHALSDAHEKRVLNITSLANNSSLLEPNSIFINRYNMVQKWTVTKKFDVDTTPLDYVMYDLDLGFKHSGEIIKLDTQGTEYEILKGAKQLLSDRTVCIVTEVEFCQIYNDQKLFSDVELYLRELGFSFYGFLTEHKRSKRALNKKTNVGRERLFYADAIFFRDPFSSGFKLTERHYHVLLFAAILTGFYDFAMELLHSQSFNLPKEELTIMQELIHSVSYVNPSSTEEQLNLLVKKVEEDKQNANIILGKFIDSINFPDFEDC